MDRRPKTPRSAYMPSLPVPESACVWCPPRDASAQFRAHLHWLRDFDRVEALKQHLLAHLTPSLHGREYTESVLYGILTWWQGMQQDFHRDIDETGQQVQAWESWAMAQARPPCTTLPALHRRLAAAGYSRREVSL